MSELQELLKKYAVVPDPTYKHEVGQEVEVMGLNNPVVTKVLGDGIAYEVKHKTHGQEHLSVWFWLDVRPVPQERETVFSETNKELVFRDRDILGLLNMYYLSGIWLDDSRFPEHIHDIEQRVMWCNVIQSVFDHMPIGDIILHKTKADHMQYDVIDGRERIRAITFYYQNLFRTNGLYFNDLSQDEKRMFLGHTVSIAMVEGLSDQDIETIYSSANIRRERGA